MSGILAVWNDRPASIAAEYERWYVTEHIPERLAVAGFRAARRYEATKADRGFFTFYELDEPSVLQSPDYLERLANPTALTRSIMPDFLNTVRSVFVERSREGGGIGGSAVVVRYPHGAPGDFPRAALKMIEPSEIICMRKWEAAPGNAPTSTAEARIRPRPDEIAGGVLVIETARHGAAEHLAAAIEEQSIEDASIGCYRLLAAWSK